MNNFKFCISRFRYFAIPLFVLTGINSWAFMNQAQFDGCLKDFEGRICTAGKAGEGQSEWTRPCQPNEEALVDLITSNFRLLHQYVPTVAEFACQAYQATYIEHDANDPAYPSWNGYAWYGDYDDQSYVAPRGAILRLSKKRLDKILQEELLVQQGKGEYGENLGTGAVNKILKNFDDSVKDRFDFEIDTNIPYLMMLFVHEPIHTIQMINGLVGEFEDPECAKLFLFGGLENGVQIGEFMAQCKMKSGTFAAVNWDNSRRPSFTNHPAFGDILERYYKGEKLRAEDVIPLFKALHYNSDVITDYQISDFMEDRADFGAMLIVERIFNQMGKKARYVTKIRDRVTGETLEVDAFEKLRPNQNPAWTPIQEKIRILDQEVFNNENLVIPKFSDRVDIGKAPALKTEGGAIRSSKPKIRLKTGAAPSKRCDSIIQG